MAVQFLLRHLAMIENWAPFERRPRHFDRARRLMIGLPAALLLIACSRNLGGGGQPGTGGGPGTGLGGGGGRGGAAGIAMGGGGGRGGAGGLGGVPNLPACPSGAPTFSVCVVNNADVLPLPNMSRDTITAAAVTVEAVGTCAAPAPCP